MRRPIAIIVTVCLFASLAWIVSRDSPQAASAAGGAPALISACRQAYQSCDVDAFAALVFTTESAESQDLSSHREMFESECHRPIESVVVEPLKPDDLTSYTLRGVRYRPTLPATGKLVIRFATDPAGGVTEDFTSFLVGQHDGRWWILTSEPDE